MENLYRSGHRQRLRMRFNKGGDAAGQSLDQQISNPWRCCYKRPYINYWQ